MYVGVGLLTPSLYKVEDDIECMKGWGLEKVGGCKL